MLPRRHLPIAVKLPLVSGGLLLLLLAGLTLAAYAEVRRTILQVTHERLDHVSQRLAAILESSAGQRRAELRRVADQPAVTSFLRALTPAASASLVDSLESYVQQHAATRSVEVWDPAGLRLLAVDHSLRPLDEPAIRRLTAAAGMDEAVGEYRIVGDSLIFPVIAAVRGPDGVLGYVIEQRRVASSPAGIRLLAELMGADAGFVVGNAAGDVWTDLSSPVSGPPAGIVARPGLLHYARASREPVVARAAPVPATPWFVVVEFPRDPVLLPARNFLRRALTLSVLIAGLGAGAAWLLSRRLTTPLAAVTAAAEIMAAGGSPPRVAVHRADELGRLEVAFNAMADQVTAARAELEQRVAERTRALEAANHELEAFSYSVSHDMRAPLRAIDGFARILLADHADELSADAHHCVDVITRNARQMGILIDDLLAFSRLSRQPLSRTTVDMTALARSAAAAADRAEAGRSIEFDIRPLPAAYAAPPLVQQVFANLIENAAKFTRPRDVARIEVDHHSANGEVAYYVRDNGVGFDMEYADQLFGVFQRLHRAEDFEGTGVGLAIVQRIVQRHGGRVWAEASPGQGATFFFTVPPEHGSDATA